MLEVKNLHARIGDKEILKGINLTIGDGEVHAIMGPTDQENPLSALSSWAILCMRSLRAKHGIMARTSLR